MLKKIMHDGWIAAIVLGAVLFVTLVLIFVFVQKGWFCEMKSTSGDYYDYEPDKENEDEEDEDEHWKKIIYGDDYVEKSKSESKSKSKS